MRLGKYLHFKTQKQMNTDRTYTDHSNKRTEKKYFPGIENKSQKSKASKDGNDSSSKSMIKSQISHKSLKSQKSKLSKTTFMMNKETLRSVKDDGNLSKVSESYRDFILKMSKIDLVDEGAISNPNRFNKLLEEISSCSSGSGENKSRSSSKEKKPLKLLEVNKLLQNSDVFGLGEKKKTSIQDNRKPIGSVFEQKHKSN